MHLFGCFESDRDAVTLAASQRLYDHRCAELVHRGDGFSRRSDNASFRDGNTGAVQQRFRVFLVLDQLDRGRARAIGHRGLNVMTVLSVTQLHETLVTFAPPGNVSLLGCFDYCARARTQFSLHGDLFCFPDLFADGERFRVQNGSYEPNGNFQQVTRRLLGFIFDRDVINARLARVSSFTVIRADVRQRRELDRYVFDDVTEVSSFREPLHEAAGPAETTLMFIQSG